MFVESVQAREHVITPVKVTEGGKEPGIFPVLFGESNRRCGS